MNKSDKSKPVKFSKAGGAYVDMEDVVKSELAKLGADDNLPATERGLCVLPPEGRKAE